MKKLDYILSAIGIIGFIFGIAWWCVSIEMRVQANEDRTERVYWYVRADREGVGR